MYPYLTAMIKIRTMLCAHNTTISKPEYSAPQVSRSMPGTETPARQNIQTKAGKMVTKPTNTWPPAPCFPNHMARFLRAVKFPYHNDNSGAPNSPSTANRTWPMKSVRNCRQTNNAAGGASKMFSGKIVSEKAPGALRSFTSSTSPVCSTEADILEDPSESRSPPDAPPRPPFLDQSCVSRIPTAEATRDKYHTVPGPLRPPDRPGPNSALAAHPSTALPAVGYVRRTAREEARHLELPQTVDGAPKTLEDALSTRRPEFGGSGHTKPLWRRCT
mmetsp:Transcript_73742/g.196549  ORF Transcript_73742/g.196549 Transcript_73742/m.196549 type:complete len:274 (+) Transcript_73742:1414-2235(+)